MYTEKKALEVIAEYKDNTAYFNGSMTSEEMYDMLRCEMKFGEAESRVIIAALVAAGAFFDDDVQEMTYDEWREECYEKNLPEAKEVAAKLKASDEWIPDLIEKLCELAGLETELKNSDEDFERVVEAAADRFGVEIY